MVEFVRNSQNVRELLEKQFEKTGKISFVQNSIFSVDGNSFHYVVRLITNNATLVSSGWDCCLLTWIFTSCELFHVVFYFLLLVMIKIEYSGESCSVWYFDVLM